MDKKLKKKAKWRTYYNDNRNTYLINRMMKRCLDGVNVKYSTLLKYDMIGYYLENANKNQLEVFYKQKRFYETMNNVANLEGQTEKKLKNAIETIVGKNANLKIQILNTNNVNSQSVDENVATKYTLQDAIKDIKYNSVTKTQQPLSNSTRRIQLLYIYRLSNILNCEEDFAVLKQQSSMDVLNKLPKQDKINYVSLINSIHRYSIKFKTMMGKDIVIYKNALDEIFKKRKAEDEEKRKKTVTLEWSVVEQMYKKMTVEYKQKKKEYEKYLNDATKSDLHKDFYKFQQLYLLFSLYVLRPPLRGGDYMNINVVDTLPIMDRRHQDIVEFDPSTNKVENYYIVPKHSFVFQNYKTSYMYNQVWFPLSASSLPPYFGYRTKLVNLINETLTMFPRKYLLCKENNTLHNANVIFQHLSQYINKKITANILRHSYITYQYETMKIKHKKKERLSKLMLHQASTAETKYLQTVQ